ncbi:MAG TPA: hypothetical protein VJ784_05645 [Pyrinomonadaceae bacterium]|nr:hypothetical protein [Pyrinomonadaceae bacterium]
MKKRNELGDGIEALEVFQQCAGLDGIHGVNFFVRLLAANENPKVVSERLGHASITLTMDTYSHVMPDMQQGASDKLEQMLFTKTGTQ